MEPTYDLILRVPIREPLDWDDEQAIEAAVVERVKMAFELFPIAGLVVAEADYDYCEHVVEGMPGDAPLIPL